MQILSGISKLVCHVNRGATISHACSPIQQNAEDCGVFTVYNAIITLRGETPQLDGTRLCLRHSATCKVLEKLKSKLGFLPKLNSGFEQKKSRFHTRMAWRELWISLLGWRALRQVKNSLPIHSVVALS